MLRRVTAIAVVVHRCALSSCFTKTFVQSEKLLGRAQALWWLSYCIVEGSRVLQGGRNRVQVCR